MGRPSKLSDDQWSEIKKRLLAGEKPSDLAREFKVSKTAISVRVSKRVETIHSVANQLVSAERALAALPVSEQIITVDFASTLRSIMTNIASAAALGAATSHRMSALANSEAAKIDDADPMSCGERLVSVARLMKTANESAYIPLTLMNANKETAQKMNEGADPTLSPVIVELVGFSAG
jgi:hypothetical protein